MGDVKKIPHGDNLLEATYSGLKGWYEKSALKPGAKGFFERAGKAIVVIPAHLLASIAQTVVMVIYDFVLALLFGIAALCTGFKKRSINGQFLGHLGSLGSLPEKALKHLGAALCPPCAYKSDNIRKVQYENQFKKYWAKEMPQLAWEAYKNDYASSYFGEEYCRYRQVRKEMARVNLNERIDAKMDAENKKFYRGDRTDRARLNKMQAKDRAIGKVPFGSNLMHVSHAAFKGWYEKSDHKTGAKGFFERVSKAVVLIPAHVVVGALQTIAMAVYDFAMALIFSLAAFFTGFKRYSLVRQALGHFGSLVQLPGQALKNFAAALCPPLTYKSDNLRKLQYRFQFSKVWIKEEPQRVWEHFRSRFLGGWDQSFFLQHIVDDSHTPNRITDDKLDKFLNLTRKNDGLVNALTSLLNSSPDVQREISTKLGIMPSVKVEGALQVEDGEELGPNREQWLYSKNDMQQIAARLGIDLSHKIKNRADLLNFMVDAARKINEFEGSNPSSSNYFGIDMSLVRAGYRQLLDKVYEALSSIEDIEANENEGQKILNFINGNPVLLGAIQRIAQTNHLKIDKATVEHLDALFEKFGYRFKDRESALNGVFYIGKYLKDNATTDYNQIKVALQSSLKSDVLGLANAIIEAIEDPNCYELPDLSQFFPEEGHGSDGDSSGEEAV